MPARQWMVTIPAHTVVWSKTPPREFAVADYENVISAESSRDARKRAVEYAHIDSEVPPFRSLLRQTWPRSRAVRYMERE